MADGPMLTPEHIQRLMAEYRRRFQEPDAWVYGIEVGPPPFGGPLPVSFEQLAGLIAAGYVESVQVAHEAALDRPEWVETRYCWTLEGKQRVRGMLSSMPRST